MWEKLYPDLFLNEVYELDTNILKEKAIRGIILDMDNTLVAWGSSSIHPRILNWVKGLKEEGFRLFIVSNSTPFKGEKLARELDIPALWHAIKPRKKAFRHALGEMGLKPDETAVIGDQIFTDVLGGNRMGLFTILVPQLSPRDFFGTKIVRMLEKRVLLRIEQKKQG